MRGPWHGHWWSVVCSYLTATTASRRVATACLAWAERCAVITCRRLSWEVAMRDWFAAFAAPEDCEMRATRATRATEPTALQKCAHSDMCAIVAQTSMTWATRATAQVDGPYVAHVAQADAARATSGSPAKAEENPHAGAYVASVAHVAHELNDYRHLV